MNDPLYSLSIAMHSNPGVFALLLGSGVSRSAQIPTGWEIVEDLIRKLVLLSGDDCGEEPSAWYYEKYGVNPDYSAILDGLAKTSTERQQLLRSYFEPSDEEREQGLKQPTRAHRAIAQLVAEGYCRVILTTNFDRLLEQALHDVGITPVVASTADDISGMLPLPHQKCCILKLNGDYQDTRIKNTPAELAEYDEACNRLLDQILDGFGLVVCGWSAQWDTALIKALKRCGSRRFSWYWTTYGDLTDEANRLIQSRDATILPIDDADTFFEKLKDSVLALAKSRRPLPTTLDSAVALLKKYLATPDNAVRLEDFLINEAETAYLKTAEFHEQILKTHHNQQDVDGCFRTLRELTEIVLHLIIHGCALGRKEHNRLWPDLLERLARPPRFVSGKREIDPARRLYPIVMLLYAAGLTALTRQRYDLFASLLTTPVVRDRSEQRPLLLAAEWTGLRQWANQLPQQENSQAPLSTHLFDVLRRPLHRYLPDDAKFQDSFYRFEYILALIYADIRNKLRPHERAPYWGPFGIPSFEWRYGDTTLAIIEEEVQFAKDQWPLLKAGLFDGSLERFWEVKAGYDRLVTSAR